MIRDVPTPVPGDRDVLIRVRASTVSSGDCRVRGAIFPRGFGPLARLALGWSGPRRTVLGTECAGTVMAIGRQVSRFKVGDDVFAFAGGKFGCHAEYRTFPEAGAIALIPAGLSFENAAALSFGGATALHFLRDRARVQRGERVLVNGAGGCVGIAAVQIARHFGAHVGAVCSPGKVDIVRSLGADVAIDYGSTDFTTGGERWDVIVDVVGNLSLGACRRVLNKGGRLLLLVAGLPDLIAAPFQSMTGGITVVAGPAAEQPSDALALKELCEAGAYRPVIGCRYGFADIVAAHQQVESGHKTGSTVVVLDS